MTLSEVARRRRHRSRHRVPHAHHAEMLGYVARVPGSKRFRLTLKVVDLGFRAIGRSDLRELARPILRSLVNEISEAASVGVLDGGDVLYVERVRAGLTRLGVDIRIGKLIPAARGMIGHAILAFLPAAERKRVLDPAAERCEPPQSQTKVELVRTLESSPRGYAMPDSLFGNGLRSWRCRCSMRRLSGRRGQRGGAGGAHAAGRIPGPSGARPVSATAASDMRVLFRPAGRYDRAADPGKEAGQNDDERSRRNGPDDRSGDVDHASRYPRPAQSRRAGALTSRGERHRQNLFRRCPASARCRRSTCVSLDILRRRIRLRSSDLGIRQEHASANGRGVGPSRRGEGPRSRGSRRRAPGRAAWCSRVCAASSWKTLLRERESAGRRLRRGARAERARERAGAPRPGRLKGSRQRSRRAVRRHAAARRDGRCARCARARRC